jgi:hypothetical protein
LPEIPIGVVGVKGGLPSFPDFAAGPESPHPLKETIKNSEPTSGKKILGVGADFMIGAASDKGFYPESCA